MKLKKISIAACFCALLPLAALAQEPEELVISDAWVRALPPGQPNTAAYLTITNSGGSTRSLVGGSSDIAGEVQIHTTREVEGYQRMERLEQVDLLPGQSVVFAPGGTHLMLLGLTKMPAPGEQVSLCLQVLDGGEVCTTAAVRKAAGQSSHEHHQH